MVKRGQDEVKSQAALMDAYTEHLNVLEMTLIAAVEEKRSAVTARLNVGTADRRRSHEAAASPNVEVGVAVGARPGDPLKHSQA